MGPTKTPRNESGSRKTRAPLVAPGPRGINQGPVGRIGAPQNQPRPIGRIRALLALLAPCIQSRIRTPINRIRNRDGAGPRGTNWGLTRRNMADGIDQGPREELGSAGRIRALRDASGPSGTRQGPSGWMRWRSKRGGGGAFGPWLLATIKEKSTGPTFLLPPPPIAKVGRLLGPQQGRTQGEGPGGPGPPLGS